MRRGLAVWLGSLRTTRLPTPTIAQHLSDPDPTVRLAAAGALEHHANTQAAIALIAALNTSLLDPPRIVERLGHAWAVPELIAHLPSVPAQVQPHLASALGLTMDPRAIAPLIALAGDSSADETRIAAARALARCAPNVQEGDRLLLSAFARSSLSEASARLRSSAIRILATPGVPTDLDGVSSALGDPDWFVRRSAAQALAALGAPGVHRLELIASGPDAFAADRAREELALASHRQRPGGDGA